jgi:hypothetical protein
MKNSFLFLLFTISTASAAQDIHGLWTRVDERGQVQYMAGVTDTYQQLKLVTCTQAQGEYGAVIVCSNPTKPGSLFLKEDGPKSYRVSTPGNAFKSIVVDGDKMTIAGLWGFSERVWNRLQTPAFFLPRDF